MVKFNINDQKCYLRWVKAAITCVSKIDGRLSVKNRSTKKSLGQLNVRVCYPLTNRCSFRFA